MTSGHLCVSIRIIYKNISSHTLSPIECTHFGSKEFYSYGSITNDEIKVTIKKTTKLNQ